ncbi:MAG: class II fumarate hydratase [Spirochaetes bacterium]|nr:MAG: class II fumarate hydratase [Spirochaetota bacterium]
MTGKFRREKDVLGEVEVPEDAYWGVNTLRAVNNFKISARRFPAVFIASLAEVKKACLLANMEQGSIDAEKGGALLTAMKELLEEGKFQDQFPIDIFQTGSGTQTNMNMNEVLANRANEILGHPMGRKSPVHPNDHVNAAQSSNDAIPAAMNLSALHAVNETLLPAMGRLTDALKQKIEEFEGIVKVGRTHLQDAVPIPLSMEFRVYKRQAEAGASRITAACEELMFLPLGGTAVGTGINAPAGFDRIAVKKLAEITGFPLKPNPVKAEGIASHNPIAALSGALRQLALALMKMANDVRWMGSGPRAGLFELALPANEPGSSIMPGKINPTQSEALIQVCVQVMGNDAAIAMAEGFGSILDLNVCKPVMICNLLDSAEILANGADSFTEHCLKGLRANREHIESQLARSLMTVTNLSPYIGYDRCAQVAQQAFRENKTIKEVIAELGIVIEGDIDALLDPGKMV